MRWSSTRLYRNRKTLLIVSGLLIPLLIFALQLPEKAFLARVFQNAFYSPFWWVSNRITSLLDVYEDNEQLTAEAARLSFELRQLERDRIENERFRKMLRVLPRQDYRLIPADVVAYDLGRRLTAVTIRANEPLMRFQPVVDEKGIVGKISSTTGKVANVSLLTGPNCRVAARVNRTNALGIIKWHAGKGLYLDDVAIESDVAVGDTVISSGMGGVFPEGLVIGVISSIATTTSAMFKEIKVRPLADFNALDNVMVMEAVEGNRDGS